MLHNRIIQCAIEELEHKSSGDVEEFFKIHQIVYEDDEPKIDRVDTDRDNDTAIVYFPVRDAKFHFALYLDTKSGVSVKGAHIVSYCRVYFTASSDSYSLPELSSLTSLKPTEGKKKGEKTQNDKLVNGANWIVFEPNPEPDEVEDKIKKLLDFLEQDKNGIMKLVDNANGYMQVQVIFHNGSSSLGSVHLDKKSVQRMNALNLAVNFDLYSDSIK